MADRDRGATVVLIDMDELKPGAAYHAMIQAVVPRPIAWVLSDNGNGSYNLAPFSYFTMVSSKPPLLMFSVGNKSEGVPKDTCLNIRERTHFVVHIAHRGLADAMTNTSRVLPHGESELDHVDLELAPMEGFPLPRVADCRVAMACERHAIQDIGDGPQHMVFGRVRRLYAEDSVVERDEKGRSKLSATGIDPLGRLGGDDYTTFGDVITVPRPG